MKKSKILELRKISKSFPGVQALKEVSFNLFEGEVHALVGENGAGKSTLMKVLAGVFSPDSGEIYIGSRKVNINNTLEARKLGISMIYQNMMLIPKLTIAENIYLGNEFVDRNRLINKKRMYSEAKKLLNEVGLDVSPDVYLYNLSASQQQMVEVAKALALNTKVIVMDEPTSSLSERETENLFDIIKKLIKKGISIIYISHRFKEVFSIADRITVLRDGREVKTFLNGEESYENIVKMMIGYKLEDFYHTEKAKLGKEFFELKNYTLPGLFYDISIKVKRGEILGVFGLIGSGRTEIFNTMFGIINNKNTKGSIFLNGKKVYIRNPKDAVKMGIGLVPEDKKELGVALDLSVRENISINNLASFSNAGFVNGRKEKNIIEKSRESFSIKTPNLEQKTLYLSGGNQQKVILAKWFLMNPILLVLDEPTKGIDVGAKKEVHELLSEFIKKGTGIILISSELQEIISLSDRVIVVRDGKISKEFKKKEINEKNLLLSAQGFSE